MNKKKGRRRKYKTRGGDRNDVNIWGEKKGRDKERKRKEKRTSNTNLTLDIMGRRSPLLNVRVLFSSNTEFKLSIQIASTGPSRHICDQVKKINIKIKNKKGRESGYP